MKLGAAGRRRAGASIYATAPHAARGARGHPGAPKRMPMLAFPPPSSEETVAAADGTKLHVERFVPAAGRARGLVVFTHGFSAHIGNFRHVGRAFADAGL